MDYAVEKQQQPHCDRCTSGEAAVVPIALEALPLPVVLVALVLVLLVVALAAIVAPGVRMALVVY